MIIGRPMMKGPKICGGFDRAPQLMSCNYYIVMYSHVHTGNSCTQLHIGMYEAFHIDNKSINSTTYVPL